MNSFLEWFFFSESKFHALGVEVTGAPVNGLIMLALIIYSCVWVARDARKRGKSPGWAVVFVLFAQWPLSLLWWRWLRPTLLPPPISRMPVSKHLYALE